MVAFRSVRRLISVLALSLPLPALAEETQIIEKSPETLFSELDKNQDGKITAEEAGEERKAAFGRLLRLGDKDGNGELTRDEFLSGTRPELSKPRDGQIPAESGLSRPFDPQELGKRFDKNRDGKITLDEVPERLKERVKRLLERDSKTEIPLADFARLIGQRPMGEGPPGGPNAAGRGEYLKRLDANGDGKITLDEVPEPMKERLQRVFERAGKSEIAIEELGGLIARIQPDGAPGGAGREGGSGRFAPIFFRRLDVNADGKLSKEEFLKAESLFSDLDADGDGSLELRELMGGPPTPGGRPTANPQAAGAGRGMARKDGRPSVQGEGSSRPERPRRPDGAGSESSESNPPAAPPADRPRNGGKGAAGRLGQLDADGDGRISRKEARGRLKENFDRIDTNQDGFLDSSEIRQALDQLGEGRKAGKVRKIAKTV